MRVKELDLLRARRNVEYVVMLCLIVLAAAVSVFVWVRRQNKMYRTLVTQYRSYIHRLEEISESRKETGDETTKEDAQYKKVLPRQGHEHRPHGQNRRQQQGKCVSHRCLWHEDKRHRWLKKDFMLYPIGIQNFEDLGKEKISMSPASQQIGNLQASDTHR